VDGGSWRLLGLIARYRGAIEYDWRTRFGIPLAEIGRSMPITEAGRLVRILAADPSSALASAGAGWDYAIDRDTLVLADLYDLLHQVHADPKNGKPKPHPVRPFRTNQGQKRFGDTRGRSRAEVISILQRARRGEMSDGREIGA
jgi:hypothetical protein